MVQTIHGEALVVCIAENESGQMEVVLEVVE